jgi:hypothetical protein
MLMHDQPSAFPEPTRSTVRATVRWCVPEEGIARWTAFAHAFSGSAYAPRAAGEALIALGYETKALHLLRLARATGQDEAHIPARATLLRDLYQHDALEAIQQAEQTWMSVRVLLDWLVRGPGMGGEEPALDAAQRQVVRDLDLNALHQQHRLSTLCAQMQWDPDGCAAYADHKEGASEQAPTEAARPTRTVAEGGNPA